jgi:hypothetical protein
MGVWSIPSLAGASDANSLNGPILPWLRSLDGLNTRDDSYPLVVAGGLTTALILPGSANGIGQSALQTNEQLIFRIGGQAFVMKPRRTKEGSPTSMLLEPPLPLNGSDLESEDIMQPRWRHVKWAMANFQLCMALIYV